MASVTVISVGSLKEGYLKEAVAEYKKRLSQYARVEEINIKEEKIKNEAKYTKEEVKKKANGVIESNINNGVVKFLKSWISDTP